MQSLRVCPYVSDDPQWMTEGFANYSCRGRHLPRRGGGVFGLLGPHGAGKSTAVKILSILYRLDSGKARVAGIDTLHKPNRMRGVIGCAAQKSGVDREESEFQPGYGP